MEPATRKKLRKIWENMKYRCYGKMLAKRTAKAYRDKGITVCDEWRGCFEEFYSWAILSGYTEGLSLDRIDSERPYCPDNCRWVHVKENNGKHATKAQHNGYSSYRSARLKAGKTVTDVMKHLGVTDGAVYQWEIGLTNPTAARLLKLAEFYGCTVDELLRPDGAGAFVPTQTPGEAAPGPGKEV